MNSLCTTEQLNQFKMNFFISEQFAFNNVPVINKRLPLADISYSNLGLKMCELTTVECALTNTDTSSNVNKLS